MTIVIGASRPPFRGSRAVTVWVVSSLKLLPQKVSESESKRSLSRCEMEQAAATVSESAAGTLQLAPGSRWPGQARFKLVGSLLLGRNLNPGPALRVTGHAQFSIAQVRVDDGTSPGRKGGVRRAGWSPRVSGMRRATTLGFPRGIVVVIESSHARKKPAERESHGTAPQCYFLTLTEMRVQTSEVLFIADSELPRKKFGSAQSSSRINPKRVGPSGIVRARYHHNFRRRRPANSANFRQFPIFPRALAL
jgi:hypothetical protein